MSETFNNNNTNPYAAPRADVADVGGLYGDTGYQPVRLFAVKGRIGRLRMLAWMLYAYLLCILAAAIMGGVLGFFGLANRSGAIPTITAIAVIPYLIFYVMAAIQRTHDMNWSAWMLLLALIPFVALIWVFKAGTQGSNRFGALPPPNPLSVTIGGLLLPVVFVVGVLAAVALPAYQQYTQRAKAAQMLRP